MSVIDNFFQKFTPFIQNVLPFCCIFFLCLCFCFLSCFYVLKNKIFLNSRLIIGGQKRGFAPHLNYWGRVPGLPPESTPMVGGIPYGNPASISIKHSIFSLTYAHLQLLVLIKLY